MMETMLFVSRHAPTEAQAGLAAEQGYNLLHGGDINAFDDDAVAGFIATHPVTDFPAVAVVHALIAMRLLKAGYKVGVFENANRAPAGAPPQFEASSLVVISP